MIKEIEQNQNAQGADILSGVIEGLGHQAASLKAAGIYYQNDGFGQAGGSMVSASDAMFEAYDVLLERWRTSNRNGAPVGQHRPLKKRSGSLIQSMKTTTQYFEEAILIYQDIEDAVMVGLSSKVLDLLGQATNDLTRAQKDQGIEMAVFKGARPHFSSHLHSMVPAHKITSFNDDEEPSPSDQKSIQAWTQNSNKPAVERHFLIDLSTQVEMVS